MSINPLKVASAGYLKRTAKAALIISVAGYLNFGGTPTPPHRQVTRIEDDGGGSDRRSTKDIILSQDRINESNKLILSLVQIILCQ